MNQGAREAILMMRKSKEANRAWAASVATEKLKRKKAERIMQAMETVRRKEAMMHELNWKVLD